MIFTNNYLLYHLLNQLFTANLMPLHRCPVIEEANELGREMRQLLYGKRSGIFRVIFDIRVTAEGENQVRILCVRRGSRDRLQPEDLKELEN